MRDDEWSIQRPEVARQNSLGTSTESLVFKTQAHSFRHTQHSVDA